MTTEELLDKAIYAIDKETFIEMVDFCNAQNLNGRETADELYVQGIRDCYVDLMELIKERVDVLLTETIK